MRLFTQEFSRDVVFTAHIHTSLTKKPVFTQDGDFLCFVVFSFLTNPGQPHMILLKSGCTEKFVLHDFPQCMCWNLTLQKSCACWGFWKILCFVVFSFAINPRPTPNAFLEIWFCKNTGFLKAFQSAHVGASEKSYVCIFLRISQMRILGDCEKTLHWLVFPDARLGRFWKTALRENLPFLIFTFLSVQLGMAS